MKQKIHLIISLFLLQAVLLSPSLYSQHKFDLGAMVSAPPATPAAATFDVQGSFENIDYLTGTLSISLPLHELKIGGFTLPITLNYMAQGCKPNRKPGVCGINWELSYGCGLTRQLNGLPDEHAKGMLNDTMPTGNECNEISYIKELTEGKRDGMWDIYHFNIPGHSGKFIKDKLTYPYDPLLQISKNAQNAHYTIKDGSGVVYDFMPGHTKSFMKWKLYEPASIDDTVALYVNRAETEPTKNYQYVSQWLPSQISVYNSHDKISFSYSDDQFTDNNTNVVETASLYKPVSFNQGVFTEGTYYGVGGPSLSQSAEVEQRKLVTSIRNDDQLISFHYSPAPGGSQNLLQYVEVFIGYQKIKTIYFQYSGSYPYYLKSIEYAGGSSQPGQTGNQLYRFSYHGEYDYYPASDSKAKDLWGYYNGANNNKTLLSVSDNLLLKIHPHKDVSLVSNSFRYKSSDYACKKYYTGQATPSGNYYHFKDLSTMTVPQAARHFSFNHALTGTLSTVTLPTGGQISYRYEPHGITYLVTYQIREWVNQQGGGIRIAEITKAENNAVQRRLIRYGNSKGSENGISENVALPCNLLPINYEYNIGGIKKDVQNLVIYSEAVNSLDICHGSAVTYKYATEYLYDETGRTQGKTCYTYNPPVSSSFEVLGVPAYSNEALLLPVVFNGNKDINTNGNDRPVNISYYSGHDPANMQLVREDKNYYRQVYPEGLFLTNITAGVGTVRMGDFEGPEVSWGKVSYLSPRTGEPITMDAVTIVRQGQQETYARQCGFLPEDQPGHQVDPNKKIFAGKYAVDRTHLSAYYNTWVLDSTVTVEYDRNTATEKKFSTKTSYSYNEYLLPYTIEKNGNTQERNVHDYNYGVTGQDAQVDARLPQWHVKTIVGSERIWTGITEYYLGHMYRYDTETGLICKDRVLKTAPPLMNYPIITFDRYDGNKGNLQQYTSQDGLTNAILWNEYGQVATVKNAKLSDIAYTSFEYSNYGSQLDSWESNYLPRVDNDENAISGMATAQTNGSTIATKNGLTPGSYIISYWTTGSPIAVNGNTAATAIRNVNGWTLYRHKIDLSGSVTLSGGSGKIDELRLHPANAQMATYTYNKQGQVNSMTDENLRTSYYEYDVQGRLIIVRDQDKKVIKRNSYHYTGEAAINEGL